MTTKEKIYLAITLILIVSVVWLDVDPASAVYLAREFATLLDY